MPDAISSQGSFYGSNQSFSSGLKSEQLSDEQHREIAELKRRDVEVRSHEAAHIAAGGQYVSGGASYSYQIGPDGKRYAVGGEVSIDTSAISGNPEATIQKMRTIRSAALAPANPSGQDRAVAAAAAAAEAQARLELMKKQEHVSGYNQKGTPKKPASSNIDLQA